MFFYGKGSKLGFVREISQKYSKNEQFLTLFKKFLMYLFEIRNKCVILQNVSED